MRVEWPFFMAQHNSNCSLRLLAIAVCQAVNFSLVHRYREQAKAYRGSVQPLIARQSLPTTETTASTTAPAMIPATPLSNIGTANPTLPAAAPTPSIQ